VVYQLLEMYLTMKIPLLHIGWKQLAHFAWKSLSSSSRRDHIMYRSLLSSINPDKTFQSDSYLPNFPTDCPNIGFISRPTQYFLLAEYFSGGR
jgi:hypothetical protein